MSQKTTRTTRAPERATPIALSASIALLVLLGVEAGSAPRRMICETWRDYIYNVETGEFIEWVGGEYEICYTADEPISRPDAPPVGDYYGGWGTPRDPRKPSCAECARQATSCKSEAEQGTRSCITYHRNWAREWCEDKKKDIDNKLIDDFRCDVIEGPTGKPVHHCYGRGIDRCVDSFENGSPTRSTTTNDSFSMAIHKWFNIGNSETTTTTWGGNKGFLDGCREADQMAKTT